MTPEQQFEKALIIAAKYHAGQRDKAGDPYILHVLRVMSGVYSLQLKTIALLHDVVEDTNYTFADMAFDEFGTEIIEAVKLLTKQSGVHYIEYLKALKENELAKIVKMADIMDNINPDRLIKLDPDTSKYLSDKYTHAYNFLTKS